MMMVKSSEEKRVSERFDTEVQVYYKFEYDIKTKVKYQNLQENKDDKRLAYSKNVSVAGLCFSSDQELECGDKLYIEVFLPGVNDPIPMEGLVKWSRHTEGDPQGYFSSGIHLVSVRGIPVKDTIYYDETYRVEWSNVLEEVLGSYRIIAQQRKDNGQ
jgi:hypothetical protein